MLDLELLGESSWRGPGSQRKPPFLKRRWMRALLAATILGICAFFAGLVFIIQPLRDKAATYDLDECKRLEEASVIFDRNGDEISRIYVMNRTRVDLTDVPMHLRNALVSQEDSRFFSHDGVDYWGILRAVFLTVKVGRVTQGASTLTQQLARNTFDLREKSIKRKLLEAFVAQRLEKHYTKNEILELYLNRIFFGSGNGQQFYGVQSAARGYFGKDVKDLSIEESATIVGLIKAPNLYSPLKHSLASIKARNMVFHRMMEEAYISPEEEETLSKKPMITAFQAMNPKLTYVYDEVSRQVKRLVGEEHASTGGFNIYTSIDPVLQRAAEESVKQRLAEVEGRSGYEHQTYQQYRAVLKDWTTRMANKEIDPNTPKPLPLYLQGSALVIDNADGAVLAVVGGRDYRDSQLNRAFASPRPVGTAFIPFVYASAFSMPNFFPGAQLLDEPITNQLVMIGGFEGVLGEWGVEAEKTKFTMGHISAREALVHSRNAATVRLAYQHLLGSTDRLDLAPLKEFVTKAGIESPLLDYPSALLGTSAARLDEMCLAYSCFPNNGSRPAKVHLINKITDAKDKVIFQLNEEDAAPVQGMDEIAAAQVNTCLVDALDRGTGSAARQEFGLKKFPAAGKTGTAYDFKDLWFLGYTRAVTCGVWVGFDRPKTIYTGAFSSRIALPIWSDIMNASAELKKPTPFVMPEGTEKMEICRKSGHRATDFCYEKVKDADGKIRTVRDTYFEMVRPGTIYNEYCTEHAGEGIQLDLLAFISPIGRADGAGMAGFTSIVPGIDPVRMQSSTIVGDDPYNSVKPLIRPEEHKTEGSAIKRAIAITDTDGVEPELPIKLPPPDGEKLVP